MVVLPTTEPFAVDRRSSSALKVNPLYPRGSTASGTRPRRSPTRIPSVGVTLPADLAALWVTQARLAGTIAHPRGCDARRTRERREPSDLLW
jgi:hypothetical protein